MSLLPHSMNQHFTCGIAAAEYYFGKKKVAAGDYDLIPNAIEADRFVYDPEVRKKMRAEHHLTGKHVVGHVGSVLPRRVLFTSSGSSTV